MMNYYKPHWAKLHVDSSGDGWLAKEYFFRSNGTRSGRSHPIFNTGQINQRSAWEVCLHCVCQRSFFMISQTWGPADSFRLCTSGGFWIPGAMAHIRCQCAEQLRSPNFGRLQILCAVLGWAEDLDSSPPRNESGNRKSFVFLRWISWKGNGFLCQIWMVWWKIQIKLSASEKFWHCHCFLWGRRRSLADHLEVDDATWFSIDASHQRINGRFGTGRFSTNRTAVVSTVVPSEPKRGAILLRSAEQLIVRSSPQPQAVQRGGWWRAASEIHRSLGLTRVGIRNPHFFLEPNKKKGLALKWIRCFILCSSKKKNAFDQLRSSPRQVWGMRHVMLHRSALVGAESPGNQLGDDDRTEIYNQKPGISVTLTFIDISYVHDVCKLL